MNYNNAINPREDTFPVEVMPGRSGKINKVTVYTEAGAVRGWTNPATGEVAIPTGNTAKERTVRYHEALHAEFTPKKATPRDLLDQALEDGRLHRHCSVASKSRFHQARRDELTTALRDLRGLQKCPVMPINNVSLFRSLAILTAGPVKDSHVALLDRAFSRLGKGARTAFDKALALLSDYANWDKARKVLTPYFAEPMAGGEAPSSRPMAKPGSDRGEATKGESTPEPEQPKEEDSESESGDNEDTESTSDEDRDTDEGDDSDSDSELDEDSDTDTAPAKIAPSTDKQPTKAKPAHPDKYTADLTPECDKETYEDMSSRFPLELRIRRLDMGINRVRLSLGRKAPLPVTSGRQILARKLASVRCNPTMRVFTRPVNQGGYGTILIDASGSMSIPEQTLISFLDKAPALTLAYYNATNDDYWATKNGNIFIYAANGYRAALTNIRTGSPEYGNGNLIDYQAMCWLIKQPAPHYLVTDQEWTGPWMAACRVLCSKLRKSGQLIVVRTLDGMEELLEAKQVKR